MHGIHARFKQRKACLAFLGQLRQPADRREDVLEAAAGTQFGGFRGQRLALFLRRADRAFEREVQFCESFRQACRNSVGIFAHAPRREISAVQPVDVGTGQSTVPDRDRIGGSVQGGIAPALVGKPEFELARFERKLGRANLLGDRIAEVDAPLRGRNGTRGRHSAGSMIAMCGSHGVPQRWLKTAHNAPCGLNIALRAMRGPRSRPPAALQLAR